MCVLTQFFFFIKTLFSSFFSFFSFCLFFLQGTGINKDGHVTYQFNIKNMYKSDSMYNKGMQPVMYSCLDAEVSVDLSFFFLFYFSCLSCLVSSCTHFLSFRLFFFVSFISFFTHLLSLHFFLFLSFFSSKTHTHILLYHILATWYWLASKWI